MPVPVIRVMLVDDSLVIRSVLQLLIDEQKDMEVVAAVSSADAAISALARHEVDVIILDIEMPGKNGIEALPAIQEAGKDARILIFSSNCREGGPAAIEALARGASQTLEKPARITARSPFAIELFDRVRRLGHSPAAIRRASEYMRRAGETERIHNEPPPHSPLRCIGLASSTGGIPAVHEILQKLPARLTVPVFITQHLPDAFIPVFAKQIGASTERKIEIGTQGLAVKANHIYLAPGIGHLTVKRENGRMMIAIDMQRQSHGCEPSADPMFATLGQCYGDGCGLVVLSGMGSDGAAGAREAHAAGATVIAQDPQSCVVWGMPGSVVRSGIVRTVLKPASIATYLGRWAQGRHAA